MAKKYPWVYKELPNVDVLMHSLLRVWSRYTRTELHPGAERYVHDRDGWGRRLFEDVRNEWKHLTNAPAKFTDDPSCFPYTHDYIIRMFVNVRKFNEPKKRKMCKLFGVKVPDNISDKEQED